MKVNKKSVKVLDKEISYTHIEVGSNTICFMFSGSGYNYDKPLFHYSTMTMLENEIDTVHIHYSYDKNFFENPIEEINKTMLEDVDAVIFNVLKNNQYEEVIFLGKSIGTIPIANNIMKRSKFINSKIILLTPLLKFDLFFKSILQSRHVGLLVIGDKDTHFDSYQIEQLKRNSNIAIEVIENANHSLDVGKNEAKNSILVLLKITEKIQEIIKRKN